MIKTVGFVSLGCDKNRVDTEAMMAVLNGAGYQFSADAKASDIIIINTCAFIQSARQEAIDAILEMAEEKKNNCRCLVVAGCLPQKYLSELEGELSEVDVWLQPQDIDFIAEKINTFLLSVIKKPCNCDNEDSKEPCNCDNNSIKEPCNCENEDNKEPCNCENEDSKKPCNCDNKDSKEPCDCDNKDSKEPCNCDNNSIKEPCNCENEDNKEPCNCDNKDSKEPCDCDNKNSKEPCDCENEGCTLENEGASLSGTEVFKKTERNAGFRQRLLTTPAHYAYLKIADGCDNYCTFCTIPSIKGHYRSVRLESLKAEARDLAKRGVRELILIAQDTTNYGADFNDGTNLTVLLKELSKIDGIEMLRLMYCYPERITDDLIHEIAYNPKLVKYIDIPFQHADDAVLRLMNRRTRNAEIYELLGRLRDACPDISIRSTFIIGFSGETEDRFNTLTEFLRTAKLDNAGFFIYSPEDGTPAKRLEGRVSKAEKLRRLKIVAGIQKSIIAQKNSALIGKTVQIIYEDIDYKKQRFVGRTLKNAPEIDCKVYFNAPFVDVGQIYDAVITGADGYDLLARLV